MFSARLPPRLDSNALARALERARSSGRTLIDLTISNPTQVGFSYPPELFRALSSPDVARYLPTPFGLPETRRAVAGEYQRRGLSIPWEHIVLTASTSEAYSLLFKLLCAPCGDSVLTPVPSYPLFEHLTALDGVAARPYRLDYDARWSLDLSSVDVTWDSRTKAVLAVTPNNPSGSMLSGSEYAALDGRCAERGAALIVDEVFADYMLDPASSPEVPAVGQALTFRLGGLSKSAALPQVKLGWFAVEGSHPLLGEALERLELICDTYLSVSTPVQVAAPAMLALGGHVRTQVLERIRRNYAELTRMSAAYASVDLLAAQGGWTAVLRVPTRGPEEQLVLQLLEQDGVLVYPGFFFDFPRESYVIVSLLPEPDRFAAGIQRVLERADA